ncbi:MAG: hypothetical protein ABR602_06045 [Gemmatimonadales bacterium]
MLTPYDVHHGLAEQRLRERAAVLARAYQEHPERFPRGLPTPGQLPSEVWINKPVLVPARDTKNEESAEVTPDTNELIIVQ